MNVWTAKYMKITQSWVTFWIDLPSNLVNDEVDHGVGFVWLAGNKVAQLHVTTLLLRQKFGWKSLRRSSPLLLGLTFQGVFGTVFLLLFSFNFYDEIQVKFLHHTFRGIGKIVRKRSKLEKNLYETTTRTHFVVLYELL